MIQDEIPLMKRFGIKEKITAFSFDLERIEEKLKNGEIDVLIYSCEEVKEGETDKILLQLVNQSHFAKNKIRNLYFYQLSIVRFV